ncbi:MAG: HD domain-containing protein [Eubacterium sp.]|nr:HD domain-containing protein [Eubacterium sp.]
MEKKFAAVAAGADPARYEELIRREDPLYSREDDIRSPFDRDYTRVLHSLAYRRLKHKTQVFYNAAGNDHICTRIEHVAHVESVSSTIAGELGLNTELTRAIALSHDLGHAPFGHEGEKVLSELSEEYLGGSFWHEANGVRFVDDLELLEDNEMYKRNLNLTYAVRDGIISHCGELDQNGIRPREDVRDLADFERAGQYEAASWEGCVVKISDKIAYLGRDIEDARRLGYLTEEQKKELRDMARIHNQKAINTTVIMHNMIIDLCRNSCPEEGLVLSDTMAGQMNRIKQFNTENIYHNPRLEPYKKYSQLTIREIFHALYGFYRGEETLEAMAAAEYGRYRFVEAFARWLIPYLSGGYEAFPWAVDIAGRCKNRKIYGSLKDKKDYIQAIIDYIAGMTDNYVSDSFGELLSC